MSHSPVSSLSIKSASTVSLQTLRPPSITILSRDVDCKPCAGRQRPNLRRTCLKCEQFFRSQTDLFFHLRTYRGTSQPLGAQSNNTKRLGDHHRPTYQALLSPTRDPGLHRRLPPCLPRLDRVFLSLMHFLRLHHTLLETHTALPSCLIRPPHKRAPRA